MTREIRRKGCRDGMRQGEDEAKDVPRLAGSPRFHYTRVAAITAAEHHGRNLERSVIPQLPVYRRIALR